MNPPSKPLCIAIVGCGQIADAHLQELGKIDSVEVAATCDRHRDLAMQAAMRFDVPRYYDDIKSMMTAERPDIVHIATPAHTHASLAQEIMTEGAHVYIEKPLAVSERELREIIATAKNRGRVVCAGHDQLFDPAWVDLRRRVAAGEIGEVRHVESILGYPVSGQFGSAVLADPQHWVRRLPGGLFQNTISHPLYRICEFLADEQPVIVANWWKRGFSFPTEMFAHIRGKTATGNLIFSTAIAPQRITRVLGTRGGLEVDLDAQSVVRIAPPALPGAFGRLEMPWRRRQQASRAFRNNLWRFMRSEISYFAGMRTLFEQFQNTVRNPGTPWPVSPEEMLRVTRLMDEIFRACRQADGVPESIADVEGRQAPARAAQLNPAEIV
jgi:predicted dehydrogenase